MATQSVLGKEIPARNFEGNEIGFDTFGPETSAEWALNGIEAIGSVIMDNVNGENEGFWSKETLILPRGRSAD